MDLRRLPALFAALAARRWRMAALSLCAGAMGLALAEPAPVAADTGLDAALEQQVRQLALDGSRAGTADAKGGPRIEVSVGQLDSRLHLAPCQRAQAYLPTGVRLWGRSRIGVRCLQGATKWNVYLPITVKVYGTALVAAHGAPAGSILGPNDVVGAEVDLAEDNSPAITDPDQAVGRVLARALQPGQSLRLGHLKARQWFAAGETVTVVAQGNGFSVAGEAQALNNGVEGQPVRVRTEGGRVLTGQPVGERRVELAL
jgi:flagella basal body P-ring formation protein FlgA